jgi:hypothetical protein
MWLLRHSVLSVEIVICTASDQAPAFVARCDCDSCCNYSPEYLLNPLNSRSRYYDRATDWTVRSSNFGRDKRIFIFSKTFILALSPVGTGVISPGVKRTWRDVNRSPLSSADVKNEWSFTSAVPIWLHGVDQESFTLTFIIDILLLYYADYIEINCQ